MFKTPNLQVGKSKSFVLYIPKGATYKSVLDTLKKYDVVQDHVSFAFMTKAKKYQEAVKPGRYVIEADATNAEVVEKLRDGKQDPVRLTFNNIRLKSDLIDRIGPKFEFGKEGLRKALASRRITDKYGLDTTKIVSIFIPNTYDIYWDVPVETFLDRMHSEYKRFWNDDRRAKAKALGLSPDEVSVLASIVEEEQGRKADERPRIAGLYLNRLSKGMPLQADPTVKFALGDFGIKRVLLHQLQVDSPYNTYRYTGLPPGPIRLPDINSLDAVLNPEQHQYLYMCAKADFSGYHAFAETLGEHALNAQQYQNALNKLQIRK
ncbi:endolytic transglycosylase MltG [Ravibacter arvi]|uniref:Endolytic murein transglycosylase n=2 Tax=Ravibacter arvi TaxID=2051041 RepID=A0ABP8LQT5_9BACT